MIDTGLDVLMSCLEEAKKVIAGVYNLVTHCATTCVTSSSIFLWDIAD